MEEPEGTLLTVRRKPKSKVWEHFDKFEVEGMEKYRCTYCEASFNPKNATRKAEHLGVCVSAPPEVKKMFAEQGDSQGGKKKRKRKRKRKKRLKDTRRDTSSSSCASGEVSGSSASEIEDVQINHSASSHPEPGPLGHQRNKRKKQKSMKDYAFNVDTMSESHQKTACEKFVQALFVTGCSFMLFGHELWRDFFNYIRPGFQIPCRQTIATTLLDKEFKKCKESVWEETSKARTVNLQTDGWCNRRKQGIMNFLVTLPKVLLLKVLDTGTNRHFAEYIMEPLQDIIEQIGPQKVFTLMGDNASNMQRAFRLIKNIWNHIIPLGCLAHALHLLFKVFADNDFAKDVIKNANYVIYTVSNSTILSSNLTAIQKKKKLRVCALIKPSKTRWGTELFSLQSLLRNKEALSRLVQAKNLKDVLDGNKKLVDIVMNDKFWINVEEWVEVMKPLVSTITEIEADDFGIEKAYPKLKAMVVSIVKRLLTASIPVDEKKKLYLATKSRLEKSLKPIHLAAVILDPADKGTSLNAYEENEGIEFIIETAKNMDGVDADKVENQLMAFKNKIDLWKENQMCWKGVKKYTALVWWKFYFAKTDLGQVAERILSAPVTSAATERSFSTFSFIHNLKRNRLSAEKAGKVTFLAHNYKLRNKKGKKSAKRAKNEENAVEEGIDFEIIEELGENIFGDDEDLNDNVDFGSSPDNELGDEYLEEYDEEAQERFQHFRTWFNDNENNGLLDLERDGKDMDLREKDESVENNENIENARNKVPEKIQITIDYVEKNGAIYPIPENIMLAINRHLTKHPGTYPNIFEISGVKYTATYNLVSN